ncbi:MAG: Do family serine endopeptidase [Gammaproteobacteria bacterium]|nr:Do family serine endopeptidase [Gammaproteobacteria bacterium]
MLKRTTILSLLCLLCFNAQAALPPQTNSLAPILKTVLPAVVNIHVMGSATLPIDTVNNEEDNNGASGNAPEKNAPPLPPEAARRKFENLGSGVIVDAKHGFVLTNAHVVSRAKSITVTLSDGHRYKAKLIGSDPDSDVAVIQIEPVNLTEIPLGNSDTLKVGDFVAAIGNPYGLDQTVTSGIISALQRNNLGIEGYENFIQTDAAINPGNSGGALIDMQGQLIGINTAILAPEGANIGIGFAIPINMARSVMEQLVQYGSVKRGTMGVLVQNLNPDLANALLLNSTQGAVISQVITRSPADEAGIKPGDVIIAINGKKVADSGEVRNTVGLLRLGARVNLQLIRRGKPLSVALVTIDPNKYIEKMAAQDPFLFGTELRNFDEVTPTLGHLKGVQILDMTEDSAAWRAGLRRGDVITSINNTPINGMSELKKAVASSNKQLLLNVVRQGGALFVVIK